MGFLIGLLTVVMVLDCVALIFLVLIQLPKKDAGAGLAFGGGATDALFGAGSGNVLTKITKYAAGTFFVLAVVLSLMQRTYHTRTTSAFEAGLQKTAAPLTAPAMPPQTPSVPPTSPQTLGTNPTAAPGTNMLDVISTRAEDTNLPIAIPVNPAPTAPTNK
jgi:preprotein translocase subunit SecG